MLTYGTGKGTAFRPLVLKSVNTGSVLKSYTAEVINSAPGRQCAGGALFSLAPVGGIGTTVPYTDVIMLPS